MCPVSVLLLQKKKKKKEVQTEVQNLKRDIINLKAQLYRTLTLQKEQVSPTDVLKLPKAYNRMSNYGGGFLVCFPFQKWLIHISS